MRVILDRDSKTSLLGICLHLIQALSGRFLMLRSRTIPYRQISSKIYISERSERSLQLYMQLMQLRKLGLKKIQACTGIAEVMGSHPVQA